VALMLQLNPRLTAAQIKQILHTSSVSDSLTGQTPNSNWGYGKLNVLQALDAVALSVPVASISKVQLTFPGQTIGTTSTAQSVSLSNTGGVALAITGIAVSGDFAQTNTCGASVAAGASCTINVMFQPTSSGSRAGTLTISDNASVSSAAVTLSGTGGAAVTVTLTMSPTTITVGQSATLTWSSSNATACTASGAWTVAEGTSGTTTLTPTVAGRGTYTLTCTGPGGSSSGSATLTASAVMSTGHSGGGSVDWWDLLLLAMAAGTHHWRNRVESRRYN
jgi:hypothetical protein